MSSSATVSVSPYKLHLLTESEGPSTEVTVSSTDMLDHYKQMMRIRRMEIACDNLYKQRLIRGFCHLYDGQEAIAIGLEAEATYKDYLITSYREHAYQLTRGDTMANIFAELMGKRSGCSNGKGGSMHLYHPEHRFFGGNGIVGAQVPLGAGLAFAAKYREEPVVSFALYGDGAANQGQIFEAANMAKLWSLPVIFLCENNQYGMGTPTKRAAAETEFYTRGHYIPGIQADGMDVLSVREACRFAKAHCLAGNGPIFLELKTYRYHGHSMSDPGITYRSRNEVSDMRANRDCITKAKQLILKEEWATEQELKALDKSIRVEVDEAVEQAKLDTELEKDELFTDIYNKSLPPFVRYPDYANSRVFTN